MPKTPKLSSVVVVRGIADSVSRQFVTLYFENKDKSGGGPITHMDYEQGSGKAVITFADAGGLRSVIFGLNLPSERRGRIAIAPWEDHAMCSVV